jgi:hypothetical protein
MDLQTVDELYGLDPVFEPGGGKVAGLAESVTVQCPYCGEAFDTAADASAGSFQHVEDCHVCCQPIEIRGQVDDGERLVALLADRSARGRPLPRGVPWAPELCGEG